MSEFSSQDSGSRLPSVVLSQKHYTVWQKGRGFYFCERATFRFISSFACLEEFKMHFSCQTAEFTFVRKQRCSFSSMVIAILMCHWCWACKTSFTSENLDPSLDRGHLSHHGWESSGLHPGASAGSFSFAAEERRHYFSPISCKLKLSPSVCCHFQADLSTSGAHQKLRICSYSKMRWWCSGMENLLFDVGLMNSSISH